MFLLYLCSFTLYINLIGSIETTVKPNRIDREIWSKLIHLQEIYHSLKFRCRAISTTNNNKSRGNLGISEFTSANPCFGHRSDFYIEILLWLQYFPKWSNSEWDIAPNVAREFMLKPYTEFIGWKCWLKFSNLIHSGKLLDTSSLWNCQHVKRERHGDPKTQSVPLQIGERCGGELWQGEI